MIPGAERIVRYIPTTDPIPADMARAAAITVCEHATDLTDAADLLAMLALDTRQATT